MTGLYLQSALLLVVAACLLAVLRAVALRGLVPLGFRVTRVLALALIAGALLMPMLMPFTNPSVGLRPPVQVFSSRGEGGDDLYAVTPRPSLRRATAGETAFSLRIPSGTRAAVLAALLVAVAAALLRSAWRMGKLWRHLGGLPVLRRSGRLVLLADSRAATPYSAWLPGQSCIVLSEDALTDTSFRRVAVAHEGQHLRSGDCITALFAEALKAIYFWNPAVWFLAGILHEFQELACDETLVGRRWLSPWEYGRCLIKAAEKAVGPWALPAGTTGMARGPALNTLIRRIKMLENHRTRTPRPVLGLAVGLVCGVVIAATAYAGRSFVVRPKLTMEEGQAVAAEAAQGATVPIEMNELVLARLNRFVGTAEGRAWMNAAFERLPRYRSMIESKAEAHRVPKEVMALALLESGMRNEARSSQRAAGIWQFIPQTARDYDLVVSEARDDRYNPEKETDAAMRLLKDLYGEFRDWRLAFKGYNEGAQRVRALIARHGTRDPWALERASSTEGYLSGAMDMMILLRSPALRE